LWFQEVWRGDGKRAAPDSGLCADLLLTVTLSFLLENNHKRKAWNDAKKIIILLIKIIIKAL